MHSSTKLKPTEASLKKDEGFVYHSLIDKRKKVKPKYKIHNVVRTADLTRTFSKGDTNNWLFKLYKTREIMIQYQTIKSINFPKDVMKPC